MKISVHSIFSHFEKLNTSLYRHQAQLVRLINFWWSFTKCILSKFNNNCGATMMDVDQSEKMKKFVKRILTQCNPLQVGHLTTDPGPTVALATMLAPTPAVNQNINNNNSSITVALPTTTTTTTTTSLDLSIWHLQSTINPKSISMA